MFQLRLGLVYNQRSTILLQQMLLADRRIDITLRSLRSRVSSEARVVLIIQLPLWIERLSRDFGRVYVEAPFTLDVKMMLLLNLMKKDGACGLCLWLDQNWGKLLLSLTMFSCRFDLLLFSLVCTTLSAFTIAWDNCNYVRRCPRLILDLPIRVERPATWENEPLYIRWFDTSTYCLPIIIFRDVNLLSNASVATQRVQPFISRMKKTGSLAFPEQSPIQISPFVNDIRQLGRDRTIPPRPREMMLTSERSDFPPPPLIGLTLEPFPLSLARWSDQELAFLLSVVVSPTLIAVCPKPNIELITVINFQHPTRGGYTSYTSGEHTHNVPRCWAKKKGQP
ncbi:hypothetical protein PROFUN_09690 [Planoprotostelium fungivorum]|uniref:Uncharacterized protein n=1 Tax=Planoprotostelium fungivorum TaxID=1890364 RepID=A0A2P6NGL3_9EUKA|nr:hypothetical protein PROFUN_09690 [Planoprotostelium fungivorum]